MRHEENSREIGRGKHRQVNLVEQMALVYGLTLHEVYMNRTIVILLAGLLGYPWVSSASTSFDRYQVILTRKPFGSPPPAAEVVRPPTPQADSFAKSLRLSMIVETDDGDVRIGFVDNRSGRAYSLIAGEAQDGIELVSASFEDEEAIIKNGEEMALLKISSGTFQEIAPAEQQARIDQARNRPSYAERRRQRAEQQAQQAQKPPEPKLTGEELSKKLHDYQLEVIRQGLPPLPIPLTPEQDAQLVAEGYLPPME